MRKYFSRERFSLWVFTTVWTGLIISPARVVICTRKAVTHARRANLKSQDQTFCFSMMQICQLNVFPSEAIVLECERQLCMLNCKINSTNRGTFSEKISVFWSGFAYMNTIFLDVFSFLCLCLCTCLCVCLYDVDSPMAIFPKNIIGLVTDLKGRVSQFFLFFQWSCWS